MPSPALGAPASSPIQVRVGEDEVQAPSPAQVPPSTWKQAAPGAVAGAGWEAALSAPICVGLTPASSFRSRSGEGTEGTGGESVIHWIMTPCLFLSRGLGPGAPLLP